MKPKKFIKCSELTKQTKPQDFITIGSDCELSFAFGRPTESNSYEARNFLTESLRTQVGCDGNSNIAELRPNQADDPITHLNNVKKCVRRLVTKMNAHQNLDAYAGSGFRWATGGHIHFGIKLKPKNMDLIRVLDLMSIYLLSLEYKKNSKRRKMNGGYGNLYAYETKSYGFEYRTLASWLYSESNAKSILSLAYILAYEFMNNREQTLKMIRTFDIRFNTKTKKTRHHVYNNYIYDNFQNHERTAFVNEKFDFYKYFEKSIRKMIKYKDYKPYVENLFSLRKLDKKFREGKGIRTFWNFKNIKLYLYRFSNDEFLREIKQNMEHPETKDKTIFIYGLNKKREHQIEVSNQHLYDLIKEFAEETDNSLNIKKHKRYNGNSIGFRWDLREEKQNLIIQILNHITEKLDIKKLANDYEDRDIAQTDTSIEDDDCDDDYDDDFDDDCDDNPYSYP